MVFPCGGDRQGISSTTGTLSGVPLRGGQAATLAYSSSPSGVPLRGRTGVPPSNRHVPWAGSYR